jgi:hypothetical protein
MEDGQSAPSLHTCGNAERSGSKVGKSATRGGTLVAGCRGRLIFCNLLQNAIVEFLALPIGGSLHEGQDYGMGIFFSGS